MSEEKKRMRGMGRVFRRGEVWHIAYCARGKEVRESSHSTEEENALRLLKRRLKEVAADSLGYQCFLGPAQRRVKIGDLLDSLETKYKLKGGRALPQLSSHLKPVRDEFGDRRAIEVDSDSVDRYIQVRLTAEKAPGTINRELQVLRRAFAV